MLLTIVLASALQDYVGQTRAPLAINLDPAALACRKNMLRLLESELPPVEPDGPWGVLETSQAELDARLSARKYPRCPAAGTYRLVPHRVDSPFETPFEIRCDVPTHGSLAVESGRTTWQAPVVFSSPKTLPRTRSTRFADVKLFHLMTECLAVGGADARLAEGMDAVFGSLLKASGLPCVERVGARETHPIGTAKEAVLWLYSAYQPVKGTGYRVFTYTFAFALGRLPLPGERPFVSFDVPPRTVLPERVPAELRRQARLAVNALVKLRTHGRAVGLEGTKTQPNLGTRSLRRPVAP